MLEWLLSKPRVLAADSEQADFDKGVEGVGGGGCEALGGHWDGTGDVSVK